MQISPETQLFIREHQTDDVRTLVLQARKYPDVGMPTAITQIAGRRIAAEKTPLWRDTDDIWYLKHLSLEQYSSKVTARCKAILLKGNLLMNLIGRFRIDCAFLATRFRLATYVERQQELCEIAAYNFPILNLNHTNVKNKDRVSHLQAVSPIDCIFLDPARRNEHGGKTVTISDCELDVVELEELLLNKAGQVVVKLSPMLDLSLTLKESQHVQGVHIISANSECRELLLIPGQTSVEKISIHYISLPTKGIQKEQHFVFTHGQEQYSECNYTSALENYLYRPNASPLKAGAFRSIASVFPIKRLHPNSHLYTSDVLVGNFPGRAFHIISQRSLNKKELKESLGDLKKASITVHNLPAMVAELRKRIRLPEGGDTCLLASILNNGQKVLIHCEKAWVCNSIITQPLPTPLHQYTKQER